MTKFSQAIDPWIDEEGLVGSSPNPTKWSSGNAILDTSIACIMDQLLNGYNNDKDFANECQQAIENCKNPDGSFDKNPGRPDALSHDDRLAMSAASRVCGFSFAGDWVVFGIKHDWMMSNINRPYWDADAKIKRWERAAHLICCRLKGGVAGTMSLAFWIALNAKFGDVSANRLMWVLSIALEGRSFFVDAALRYWRETMRRKYSNVGELMSAYLFGSPYANSHPFVVYGSKISF